MNIETGVPVPPPIKSSVPQTGVRALARALEVGQSIMFTEWKDADSARHAMFKAGRKYKLRKLKEGWRLWRST